MHPEGLTRFIGLGVNIVLVLTAFSARAAPDQGKQARAQFENGLKLFDDGEFENAAIAFDRAYQLRPSYKILYNIAQAENELKHYARALEAYSKYLEEGGTSLSEERIGLVQGEIERLETLVGTVVVRCPVSGAKVMLDGERRGETPLLGPIFIEMGKHEIVLRKGLKELYRESFRIAGGQQLEVSLGEQEELVPAPALVETPAEPVIEEPLDGQKPEEEMQSESSLEPKAEPAASKRVWTWITLGIGAAAGIAGGVTGGISMKKKTDLEDSCRDNHCEESRKGEADTIEKMNLTADVLFGVAGAGIITGIVLFFVEPKINLEKNVAIVPAVFGEGAGLTISRRF